MLACRNQSVVSLWLSLVLSGYFCACVVINTGTEHFFNILHLTSKKQTFILQARGSTSFSEHLKPPPRHLWIMWVFTLDVLVVVFIVDNSPFYIYYEFLFSCWVVLVISSIYRSISTSSSFSSSLKNNASLTYFDILVKNGSFYFDVENNEFSWRLNSTTLIYLISLNYLSKPHKGFDGSFYLRE